MKKLIKYSLILTVAVLCAISFFPRGLVQAGNATSQASVSNKLENTKIFENQQKLVDAVPTPTMETSLERTNIVKRAELFNTENKISYIYLVNYGKVMAFYTVKGKVSSVSSYLVPQEQLVNPDGSKCSSWGNYSSACFSVQAPDIDGSYGTNGDGIFFFTTDGAYVEWKGDYMLSDQPLQLTTTPELVRNIK